MLGLGIVGAGIALVSALHRRDQRTDLGAVSNQWISEHRLGQGQDSRH
jgi:hypothetical protein